VGRDWRDDKIEQLEGDIGHYKAVLAERDRVIDELMGKVQELTVRVGKLEEQARKSSRNSSKPPSSDGPAAPPRAQKGSAGRKPGGQPGHERHERELVPPDKVDEFIVCKPDCCDRCAARLRHYKGEPERHQRFELPEVRARVTEYRVYTGECDNCGAETKGRLPAGVPTGIFGPTVDAVVALLMGIYRLSKRQVPALLHDLYGLPISTGAVIGAQERATEALATPVDEARMSVAQQAVKHADETSWRQGARRAKAWLWVAVTRHITVFLIHARRTEQAARALLGAQVGVLVADRHGAYNWWPDRLRQFCWAHLKRDVLAIAERGTDSERIGKAMLEEINRMFVWWHRVRDGTLARSTFRVYMRGLQRRFETLLAEGASIVHVRTSKTCKKLLKHADALWTFVRVEGVEPTNNAAEQAVRHGVILRKISYGTHSDLGSRFIERILTVHATLRQQRRPILDFLRTACQARLNGSPAPSLLPAAGASQSLRTSS
jgi:transposase